MATSSEAVLDAPEALLEQVRLEVRRTSAVQAELDAVRAERDALQQQLAGFASTQLTLLSALAAVRCTPARGACASPLARGALWLVWSNSFGELELGAVS